LSLTGTPGVLIEVGGPLAGQRYVPVLRARVAFPPAVADYWAQADSKERNRMMHRFGQVYTERLADELGARLGPIHGETRILATTIDADHPEGLEWLTLPHGNEEV
jgi:hypothetical protein